MLEPSDLKNEKDVLEFSLGSGVRSMFRNASGMKTVLRYNLEIILRFGTLVFKLTCKTYIGYLQELPWEDPSVCLWGL